MKQHRRILMCLSIMLMIFSLNGWAKKINPLMPSGTVKISSQSIAVGLGIIWGTGVLTYKGKDYPFILKGLSVMDLGVSKVTAKGEVYDLTSVTDFAGKYAALEGGFALGKGESDITMKNTKGVVSNLTAAMEGVQLILGGKGLSITFQEP